jgi:ABC-type antimicrobial peptide transport system permease subunit
VRTLSRVLIIVGLFVAVVGNLVTAFGIHTAMDGVMTGTSGGLAEMANGMHSAFRWVHVGILGYFVLVAGLVLAALKPSARPGAA